VSGYDTPGNVADSGNGVSLIEGAGSSGRAPGYYSAEYEGESENGMSFLACGTYGRLDRIFEDGTVENIPLPVQSKDLTRVLIGSDITLVCGYAGALAYSRDGQVFEHCYGVEKYNILGMTVFQGKYYASTGDGAILSSTDGVSWSVNVQLTDKPLIAIAADNFYIMAVTADTDIIESEDGDNWSLHNYNEIYRGLATELTLLDMVNIDETFIMIGHPLEDPDVPEIMVTYTGGEVWSALVSREINSRPPSDYYPMTISAVRYFEDELLAACDGGRILAYTSCPTCNVLTEISSFDLHCMAINDNTVLAAGEGFEFMVLDAASVSHKD